MLRSEVRHQAPIGEGIYGLAIGPSRTAIAVRGGAGRRVASRVHCGVAVALRGYREKVFPMRAAVIISREEAVCAHAVLAQVKRNTKEDHLPSPVYFKAVAV